MEVKQLEIASHLLWEFDLSTFDYQASRKIVIERVIERGNLEDWRAMVSFYGKAMVREIALSSKHLSSKDRIFTSIFLDSTLLHTA